MSLRLSSEFMFLNLNFISYGGGVLREVIWVGSRGEYEGV